MRRFGRKLDDEALRRELPLSVFFFDCLLRDGESLVDRGAGERRDALEAALPPSPADAVARSPPRSERRERSTPTRWRMVTKG